MNVTVTIFQTSANYTTDNHHLGKSKVENIRLIESDYEVF